MKFIFDADAYPNVKFATFTDMLIGEDNDYGQKVKDICLNLQYSMHPLTDATELISQLL